MLILFTASSDQALDHLETSVVNEFPIKQSINLVEPEKRHMLNGIETSSVWGVKNGVRLSKTWDNMPEGATVLIYTGGKFAYSAKVNGKIRSKELAEKIWGLDSDNRAWENLFFLDEVETVDIDRLEFNDFFGYDENHFPQGFKKVRSDRLQKRLETHGTIDEILSELDRKK
ncbi:hypothetical protein SZL87_07680 [Exiguobacterium indicum]|uniref:Uncharacterized protein n=1 Tax=Exiguobacterium indicum TaxID=296995 RepID=A0ABU8EHX2_9BACL|nr:hypothetical protein [Exiguobacterium acetylicum]KNH37301.1 hypothetical protein ACS74_02165 [Exiguobacterium acetylicum]